MALTWGTGVSLVGPQGQAGSMVYFGNGAPAASLGATNDAYFAQDTFLFYSKGASGWNSGTLLRGGMGVTGVNGASFMSGSGAPTMSANGGDLYVDLSAGEIYKYVSGAWQDQGYSIRGPQGLRGTVTTSGAATPTTSSPANSQTGDRYVVQSSGEVYSFNGTAWIDLGYSTQGPMGSVGAAGTRGTITTSGSSAPTTSNPANSIANDRYVLTTTGEVYSFDGTKWNDLGYSIIGPQGIQGVQGTQGIQGVAGLRGTQSFSGTAAPTSSNPANSAAGDFYFQTNAAGTAITLYQLTGS